MTEGNVLNKERVISIGELTQEDYEYAIKKAKLFKDNRSDYDYLDKLSRKDSASCMTREEIKRGQLIYDLNKKLKDLD